MDIRTNKVRHFLLFFEDKNYNKTVIFQAIYLSDFLLCDFAADLLLEDLLLYFQKWDCSETEMIS